MPKGSGRTDRPGNSRVMQPIKIRTAHPEKLSLSDGPTVPPDAKAVVGGNVPKREKGQYLSKAKHVGKKYS